MIIPSLKAPLDHMLGRLQTLLNKISEVGPQCQASREPVVAPRVMINDCHSPLCFLFLCHSIPWLQHPECFSFCLFEENAESSSLII